MKAEKTVFYEKPIILIDDPCIPIPDDKMPYGVDESRLENNSQKAKKIISDVVRDYYRKNKAYGDLTVSYDGDAIAEIAKSILIANKLSVDSQQLQTEIEGNIISGNYKLSTDNDIFVYLFIAGIAIAVYFYFKSKK
jgi:uncharacterized protein YxjI